jgi:NADH-quinone oxidoreductase subunit M
MLWLYQRVFFGEVKHDENKGLKDVNLREILTLAPLIVFCFWIGLYPKPFFEMTAASTGKIVTAVTVAARKGEAARVAAASSVPAAAPVVPAAVVIPAVSPAAAPDAESAAAGK